MTTHELATALMLLPDVPVVINGWGSMEGFPFEVSGITEPEEMDFLPVDNPNEFVTKTAVALKDS